MSIWMRALLLAGSLAALAAAAPRAGQPDLTGVPSVEKAPALDGDLGDDAWLRAPVLKLDGYCDQARRDRGEKPKDAAEARLVTDLENLYVAFRCQESHPEGPWLFDGVNDHLKKRNYQVLAGDYAALALDLGRFGLYNYYFFAVSPKGEVYRCFAWPHRYDLVLTEAGLPAVQGAARVDKAGKCWTAEMSIPLRDLLRHPADGIPAIIGADLRRVQWGDERGKQKFAVYWTGMALVEKRAQNLQYDHMATWRPLFKAYPDYPTSYACGFGWAQLIFPESFGPLKLEAGKLDNKLVSGQGAKLVGHVDARTGWDVARWERLAQAFDAPRMEYWEDLRPEHPAGKPEIVAAPGAAKAREPGRFAEKPSVKVAEGSVRIAFKAAAPTDCAVAIIDAQGNVVRHLAAGVLGAGAPEPFKRDSLAQELLWDLKDDAGKPVSAGNCRARVALGLAARFDHAIALDKNKLDEDKWPKGLDVDNLPNPPDLKKAWPSSHSGYAFGTINYLSIDRLREELYVQERYVHEGASGKPLRELKLEGPPGAPFGGKFGNGEIAVGPDGLLYVSGANEVWCFDRQGKPVNFPAVGRPFIPELWGAHSNPHRGICVAPDGDIYKVHHYQPHTNPANQVTRIGPDGRIRKYGFIELRCPAAGVRVDRRGNIYVGCTVQPPGALPPKDLAEKLPDELRAKYPRVYGSILKFGPEGGMLRPDPKGELVSPGPKGPVPYAVQGAAWIHPGISPMLSRISDSQGGPGCACRNARFDLDDFGRLFIPDAVAGRIEVTDGNANTILFIGGRGKAGEAAGIELGWPAMVAACDRALYIADYLRCRIVRVKLEYAAEETCEVR